MSEELIGPRYEFIRHKGHDVARYPAQVVVLPPSDVAIGCVAGKTIGLGADSKFTPSDEVSIYLMGDGAIQDSSGNVLG